MWGGGERGGVEVEVEVALGLTGLFGKMGRDRCISAAPGPLQRTGRLCRLPAGLFGVPVLSACRFGFSSRPLALFLWARVTPLSWLPSPPS